MRVLVVTSEGACGIAEHSAYLKASVEAADPSIQINRTDGVIHPTTLLNMVQYSEHPQVDLVHLNYHAALHSQYTPDVVRSIQALGKPTVITYHDTGVPNSSQCLNLYEVADAFVVHEPCEDLPEAHYWRQGIPAARSAILYGGRSRTENYDYCFKAHWSQPVLGSVGFPFGWKGFDLLAQATARAGWALLLMTPRATPEDIARWTLWNPDSLIIPTFEPAETVVSHLSGCDATAFCYACANTGTSGAIRQGIAARKPVIASEFPAGRQMRDLQTDDLGSRAITWINPDLTSLVRALSEVKIAPIDAGMVALATQDSWKSVGEKYARLYASLVN
jgi:hypothetical protein